MHPHLSSLHELYLAETQPFRKVHRMIDLFESIIKTHTVVIMSEYVRHNKLSDTAKGLLSQGLRTPSLGTWQLFSRVLFEELQKENFEWTLSDFAAEFIELDKALNADKTNVIAFRNGYAHGATPSDSSCEADIKKHEPFLHKLLQSKWLSASSFEEIDGKVFLRCKGRAEAGSDAVLSLHPILLYRHENSEASFAFFNDIKNDKIGLLNYPLGKHYREKDFFREFHEYLPLHEWKKTGNNEFYQRIEELTETFKGRTHERASLVQFVSEKSKGYCSIQGNPGIGKSAIIAQFFKDLKAHKELKQLTVIEYFIRRGTQQAQAEYLFNYLIKRTDEVFPQGKEIRAEGKMVFDLQNQLFSKWRMWNEHCQGKKLLFLIDGLDEGTENNVVTYLPRENFENILFIYGSRPGGHKSIDDLWGTLSVEHHMKLELTGLSKEDIRALIYEVANKYEVERESTWIDAVQQRSQGNPLYLKLLCDALENGSIALNDIGALPKEIDEYYRAILQRYAADLTDGDALLAGLYTFAAAKDYLTMAHLGLINKLGEATVQRIGSTLKEVLYENPLTEAALDYQLFHESFREYLVKEKALKVLEAGERIIDFCAGWRELEGSWEQRYALEHYAAHLYESVKDSRSESLLKLMWNEAYFATQKKVLRGFDSSNTLFRLSLLKASDLKRYDEQLEAALGLVDLKYEEANDAPQIVAMVANGEIELALKRIESFGGNDNEGVLRRFILYMLCLMELTLLESKAQPFRKSGIQKLLNHLDEHLPSDYSILNWNDFFPSKLMFQMACVWTELGIGCTQVYSRTEIWDKDWIPQEDSYSDLQVETLISAARTIEDLYWKSRTLEDIATELIKGGMHMSAEILTKEAIGCSEGISAEIWKSRSLAYRARELAKQEKLGEAFSCVFEISDEFWQDRALMDIHFELTKICSPDRRPELLASLDSATIEVRAIKGIIVNHSRNGNLLESLDVKPGLTLGWSRNRILKNISNHFAKLGCQWESVTTALAINNRIDQGSVLNDVASELAEQGRYEDSLRIARDICDDRFRSIALVNLALIEARRGEKEKSASILQESIISAEHIQDDFNKGNTYAEIVIKLSKFGQNEAALSVAQGISHENSRSNALKEIAVQLAKKGQVEEAIVISQSIGDEGYKSSALMDIAKEMAGLGKEFESLHVVQRISDDYYKANGLMGISVELFKQGHVEKSKSVIHESLSIARGISNGYWKARALKDIAKALIMNGYRDESNSIMQEALLTSSSIIDNHRERTEIIGYCSIEFAKQGNWIEAEGIVQDLPDKAQRDYCWKELASATTQQLGLKRSFRMIKELKSREAIRLYLKGCIEDLESIATNADCIQEALPYLAEDPESVETLLQKYASREVALGKPSKELTARLNRTLNIQWLLDITAQFPGAEAATARTSTNLDTWLQEIADEDDREQIELWAKQVAKGKITEEEFAMKIKDYE